MGQNTEQEKPHVNVMICTPGHSMTADYVKSLLATAAMLNEKKITWGFSNGYSSHVADAREVTASGTMANSLTESRPFQGNCTYDKLMWIDSDIVWAPADVLALYESDKDIISGGYILSHGDVAAYPVEGKSGFTMDEVKRFDEPLKIAGCGFGFVAVKSGVFESLSRPWFQSAMTEAKVDGKLIQYAIMGEDLSWCKRVQDNGYEIWFDPKVKVTHQKTVKLTWEGIMPNV